MLLGGEFVQGFKNADANNVDLDFLNSSKWQVGQQRAVQALLKSDDGLVYGNLTLKYQGNNQYSISSDTYNFEQHHGLVLVLRGLLETLLQ